MGAPAQLQTLCEEGLQSICGAKFTRKAALLQNGDTAVELAVDAGFLFSGSLQQPLCEIEVELKQGTPAQAQEIAAVLAAQFALAPEEKSKFRRALALWEEQHG